MHNLQYIGLRQQVDTVKKHRMPGVSRPSLSHQQLQPRSSKQRLHAVHRFPVSRPSSAAAQ